MSRLRCTVKSSCKDSDLNLPSFLITCPVDYNKTNSLPESYEITQLLH